MPDAAYYRAWRKAHPEYRHRQNILRAERRQAKGRDRRREYATRPSRAAPPPDRFDHPVLELARRIVGPQKTSLTTLYDPLHDDLVAVAALALVEGSDPTDAVARYRTDELRWGRVTCQIPVDR